MYTKPQTAAQAATAQAQAARLAELRYTVLDTVNYSPYATAEEKARTAASVAKCQNADVLVKWYCNVLTLLSARELAAPAADVYASGEQKKEIISLLNRTEITKGEKTKVLLAINRLTVEMAQRVIGQLWARVIERAGEKSPAIAASLATYARAKGLLNATSSLTVANN